MSKTSGHAVIEGMDIYIYISTPNLEFWCLGLFLDASREIYLPQPHFVFFSSDLNLLDSLQEIVLC